MNLARHQFRWCSTPGIGNPESISQAGHVFRAVRTRAQSKRIAINSKVLTFECKAPESERAIDLLKERRTALISAAVTGKIDVRVLA